MRRKGSKRGRFGGSETAGWERAREKLPHLPVCLPGEARKVRDGSSSPNTPVLWWGELYVQKAGPECKHPTWPTSGCPHSHFAFFHLDLASKEVKRTSWGGKVRGTEG